MSWAVAPGQDLISQEWGCTDYQGEWAVPLSLCPSGHYHAGIDLGYSGGGAAACGRPVYATRGGVVVQVGTFAFGGSQYLGGYLGPDAVCVRYDDGVYVWHGHLSSHQVSVGQRVSPGQQLGTIGSQGASSACHLHVEARVDGPNQGVGSDAAMIRDPRPYLEEENVALDPNDPIVQEIRSRLGDIANQLVFGADVTINGQKLHTRVGLVADIYNLLSQVKQELDGLVAQGGGSGSGGLNLGQVADLLDAASAKARGGG